MNRTLLSTAALALLAAACQPYDDGSVRTDTTPSVAFQPGVQQIDIPHGTWGTQSIEPPPGLVLVRQGDLIGRTVDDGFGQGELYVEYLLADPSTGDARYAVASSNKFGGYILVPLSAIYNANGVVAVQAKARDLELMPHYSMGQIERRWPFSTITARTIYGVPPAPLPPATLSTTTTVTPEALQLVRRGSVVGYPVVDSFGQPVGQVDSVAALPGTGEVRYAIVASPSFAMGTYIAVPAASTSTAGGRVVLNGSMQSWSQAPHYRADQIQQLYGSLGTVN